ncbi:hypothetical protein EJ08DRAFT_66340 [Tothia fuscella]|uniref:Uncharacterized protein n=1 Tax=Tothia fuscella TaxID=1048955 RepID=A0A9P4NF84_9PEZI|nr:hypothetical protein EJ08DRAFT_66340 [Tothia fuscella]
MSTLITDFYKLPEASCTTLEDADLLSDGNKIKSVSYHPSPATSSPKPTTLVFSPGRSSKVTDLYNASFLAGYGKVSSIVAFSPSAAKQKSIVNRVSIFRAMLTQPHLQDVVAFGGHSFGAKAAIRGTYFSPVKRIVCFAYVLHRDMDVESRVLDFINLDEKTEVLFLIGEEDATCTLSILTRVRSMMKAKTWYVRLEGMSHHMNHRKWDQTARNAVCSFAGYIAAKWVTQGSDDELTEACINWDEGPKKIVWGGWQAPKPKAAGEGLGCLFPGWKESVCTEIVECTSNKKRRLE